MSIDYPDLIKLHSQQTCRHCRHRMRFALNAYSKKVVQCCDLQPSKHSNSGYKTIKINNPACWQFDPEP